MGQDVSRLTAGLAGEQLTPKGSSPLLEHVLRAWPVPRLCLGFAVTGRLTGPLGASRDCPPAVTLDSPNPRSCWTWAALILLWLFPACLLTVVLCIFPAPSQPQAGLQSLVATHCLALLSAAACLGHGCVQSRTSCRLLPSEHLFPVHPSPCRAL